MAFSPPEASRHRPYKREARAGVRRRVLLAQTWWEDRVLGGVAAYAAEHDWELDCRMRWTHRAPSGAWLGDGILVKAGASPALVRASRSLVKLVRDSGLPVVDMQELNDVFGAPKVFVPHEDIGRVAANHLVALGFRDLAYVAFEENDVERARREAFRRHVEAAGRIFHAYTVAQLRRALPGLEAPMGLCALNDLNAIQVMHHCIDAGRLVPEEFAVLGADDATILCERAPVPLSSVSCDFERQGYAAAALLDRLMNGEPAPGEAIRVPAREVTARRSTDTVAVADLDTARMLRFLRDHHAKAVNVQEAAAELGVSLNRVRAGFKAHLGRSVLAELTRLRVEHGKTLLRDRRRKLDVVAREAGFSSRFHFLRAFRRTTGMSPRTFRAGLEGGNLSGG